MCIPLQEPNKTKNEVPHKFEKAWHHRDAVPGHHVMPRQFGPNCLGITFGKRGASFLSLDGKQSTFRAVTPGQLPPLTLPLVQKRHRPRHENGNLPCFQSPSGLWTRPARLSERHCILFFCAKTDVRVVRTERAAATDAPALNKNARNDSKMIAVWLRLHSAQMAGSVPLTMLLSRGVRMLQLLIFAYL